MPKGNKTNHANAGRKAMPEAERKVCHQVYITLDQAAKIRAQFTTLTNAILTTIK